MPLGALSFGALSFGALCAVLVGVALLVAAVAKLSVRGWAAQTAAALRVPAVATAVTPALELLVGAAVLARVPGANVVALVMLVAYTAVLASRLGGPPCACFGRDAKPITGRTIARNVGLIAACIGSFFP